MFRRDAIMNAQIIGRMYREMYGRGISQKELEEAEFTATAGGSAVTVVVSGKKEIKSLKLNPEVVDPDDVEMLEDLIVAALNEAFSQVDEKSSEAMGKMTGGLGGFGGGFPF